jgi:hypothetical protein
VSVITAYLPDLVTRDPGMIDREGVGFLALTSRRWINLMLNAEAPTPGVDPLAPWQMPSAEAPPARRIQPAESGGAIVDGWLAMSWAERRKLWQKVAAHMRALDQIGGGQRGPVFAQQDLLALLPQAVHVVSYLDQHTASPIRATLSFMLQVFVAGLQEGILTMAYPVPAGRRVLAPREAGEGADQWAWARHDSGFVAHNTEAVGLAPPIACRCPHSRLDAFLQQQLDLYFTQQATLGALAEEQDWSTPPAAGPRQAA